MSDDKIYRFKGKTLEELQQMTLEEFCELLPSQLRRKILKRGFTDSEKILLEKVRSGDSNIRTHAREMVVLPEFVGKRMNIYNGKEFVLVIITEEMVGLRLGELAPSKKIGVMHSGGGAKKTSVRK